MMHPVDQQDPQIDAVIGAVLEVHRQLGQGFVKAVYQEAAVIEFALRDILFQCEALLPVSYKDHFLPTHYKADFVCFSDIFIEFKAISSLSEIEEAQALNCLKATRFERGLLINFGAQVLEYRHLSRNNEVVFDSINKLVKSV